MKIFGLRIQFFFRWNNFWIGAHYSTRYESLCICLVPFFPVRLTWLKNQEKYVDVSNAELRLKNEKENN